MVRTTFVILIALFLTGCSSQPRIVVGSKNFTEQVILGEILAQHIERSIDVPVERRLNLGGTLLAHEALKSGSIDLYPEYTGTALTAVLKQPIAHDPGAVIKTVRAGYNGWNLRWLDPLGFNNTFAMVVRSQGAPRTLTEAAGAQQPWRVGVGYEFLQRPDGYEGLVRTYGLKTDGRPRTMDLGLLYPALETGQIDMAAANATDGLLIRPEFAVVADDRHYFPPYECAVVVRQAALDAHPELGPALRQLSGRVTDDAMRRMNAAVDGEHIPVAEVAKRFLAAH
jgi:glycine betaine/choline ABC-type transport system substrate-binding protein